MILKLDQALDLLGLHAYGGYTRLSQDNINQLRKEALIK